MKSIFVSKTFWVQIIALLLLVFPPVKAWLEANPVQYLSALAAVNVLLRFATSGAVSILPEPTTAGPDDTTARETRGPRLFAWLLPVGLGGILGFSLPACAPGASGSAPQLPPVPIHATYHKGGLTVGYDSKGGLSVDQDSGK